MSAGIKRLYHYTTSYGAEGIEEDERINKASQHDFYGTGVYFSDQLVGTDCTREEMARINYGQTDAALVKMDQGYIDYVVTVDIPLYEVECVGPHRPHVWLYPGEYLDLTDYIYTINPVVDL